MRSREERRIVAIKGIRGEGKALVERPLNNHIISTNLHRLDRYRKGTDLLASIFFRKGHLTVISQLLETGNTSDSSSEKISSTNTSKDVPKDRGSRQGLGSKYWPAAYTQLRRFGF